jgi:hypothetical protein
MSVLSVKNLQEVEVGKNIGRTASVQITDPTNATTYIADGEIVVLNSSGAIYDSATMSYATSPWIQIVQRSGNELIYSSKIYGNKVISYTGQGADAQGTEQITHIGYNGSTGSIDTASTADYKLTIIPNHDDMMFSEQKLRNVTVVARSVAGTSQLIAAQQIVQNVMKKYITDGIPVTACMLNSGAAAILTGAATVAVTHGSTTIVPNAAITNVGFGAGSLVRIGVTGSAVGVTVPVYTVKGAHPTIANAWVLDQPYAGPSNSALAVANAGLVTAGASYGVRFTGKTLNYVKDFFKFKRTAFTVEMNAGFGTTVLTKTQNMTYGQGDGRLVLEEESFCKGFQGALNRMTVPLPSVSFDANGGTTTVLNTTYADAFVNAAQLYETVMVSHYGENLHTTTPSVKMPQGIKLFLYPAATQNKAANTGVLTALDDWMASTPNAFAAIAGSFS